MIIIIITVRQGQKIGQEVEGKQTSFPLSNNPNSKKY